MAEVPVARSRPVEFIWPLSPVPAQPASTEPLAAADPVGTRVLPPPTGAPLPSRRQAASAWLTTFLNLLRVSDLLVITAAVAAGYASSVGSAEALAGGGIAAETGTTGGVVAAVVVGILWLVSLEVYRTRDPKVLGVGPDEYKRVASASLRVFGLMAIIATVFSVHGATAFVTVSLPLGLMVLTGSRWAFRRWLTAEKDKGHHLSRAIVVGDPEDVRYVVRRIAKSSGAVYQILGVCLPGARRGGSFSVDKLRVPVLSSTDDIARTARFAEADAVIVAGPLPGGNKFIRELGWKLEDCAAELVLAATLTNVAGPRIHWRPVEGLPLMHVDIPQYSGGKHVLKRTMDVAMALTGLVVLSPLLLVLAVVVQLDSPGPILFHQDRVGRDGRTFQMLKFRTMVADAEDRLAGLADANEGAGMLFKLREDPRVTRCGRWMRRYSLDELPQIWNVIVGQMSMVGPRPPLIREVNGYELHTHRRLLIKPGLTGLWQINGRSDLPWEEAVRLDLYYVENWSLAGDLVILWRTFRAVIRPSGAY